LNAQNCRLSDSILLPAFDYNASDIHIVQGVPPIYRINGEIYKMAQIKEAGKVTAKYPELGKPLDKKIVEQIITEILTRADITLEEMNKKKNVDFAYQVKAKRFRINVYFEKGGLAAACRVLPEETPRIEELYADPAVTATLCRLAELPNGLVLINGPTGSGKSTTLAAIIKYINEKFHKSVITIEDPIEYIHTHKNSIISQREIGRDVLSFSDGLRAALRQDPDVILVGEMRDQETVETALHAAKTGHLVFSTLHTGSASETVDRIIGMFPGDKQAAIRMDLADALKGVVAQRLVRKRSGGRVPAVEIMVVTPSIRALIREGKTHQIASAIQTGKNEGMVLMEKSLSDLIHKGIIEEKDALKYTSLKDLRQYNE